MGSFASRSSGRLCLAVEGLDAPDDPTWGVMLKEIRARQQRQLRDFRVLVYSAGGSPTGAQRQALLEALGGMDAHTALLTNRWLARVVGWTLGILTGKLRSFAADDFEGACDFLDLQPKEREFARAQMGALAAEIGVDWRPPVAGAAGDTSEPSRSRRRGPSP